MEDKIIFDRENFSQKNDWLKSWEEMQEVSHSQSVWQNQNGIILFTPKLWLCDVFWVTLAKILKLREMGVGRRQEMQEVSHGIFLHLMTPKWNLVNVFFWPAEMYCWKLHFRERQFFNFFKYYESKFSFQQSLKKQCFMHMMGDPSLYV